MSETELSFSPRAIREHFEGDDTAESRWVEKATDDQLLEVALDCICADTLYAEFHRLLVEVIGEQMDDDSEIPSRKVQARSAGEKASMLEAHAEGMHIDNPREFCPDCEDS